MLSGFSFELIISYKQSALNHEPLTINLSSISHHTSAISLLYYSIENTKMLHAFFAITTSLVEGYSYIVRLFISSIRSFIYDSGTILLKPIIY